jgi:hypothetical protein
LLFIDYSWDAEILNCQNQDVQDLRIFRMVIDELSVNIER